MPSFFGFAVQNSRIDAFASAKYCDEVLKKIKEGAIYIVSNIKVKEYLGSEKFRAVRNKKHVFFTPHTKFELDETMGLKIEKFAFDLFHFDEIEKLENDERFLIDMVGKVKNIQELIKTTKNDEEKSRLKFDICNGRSTVPVTLFDTFGEDVEKEFFKRDINNIFVIICCAKVGRYEGVPHLSNYPATRVYINPEHYSVDELKKRFRICTLCSDSTGSISIIFSDCEINKLIGKTVTDLHAECADEAEEEKSPNILNSIVKVKYTIQLYMAEENIKNGSTIFEAKEVKQAQEKADNFDHNIAAADEIQELSMNNATEGDSNLNHTPNTENSTNTKFRARKITEVVTFNAADTTKWKRCETLLQSKRVHAFVPTKCADEFEDKITVGKTYVIKNFAVQLYSATEKFRLLRNDSQLVFSMDTKIQEVADDGLSIGQEAFDFYDHSQLEELSKQTTYLTGFDDNMNWGYDACTDCGRETKMKNPCPLCESCNRFVPYPDKETSAKVIFYDEMAQSFNEEVHNAGQHPVILILASVKAALIQGEAKLTNYPSTRFFINPHHEAVEDLRDAFRLPLM
ncbi:hypothetical protein DCAR_0831335 [Daucus carota subsp. sativus]|uniref:Uncharacterized protein n=1 Tax=Daucus carota subsp. sativus TaxID=79200 RepID=A0A175YLB4_DAUCS|nr:hypothetical protein DCAR_0831335 [Daucus carota subsp. sativus]